MLIIILVHHLSFGQQDPQFSQYMFNTLFYNPAFAGVEGITQFTAIHRTQWTGYTSTFDGGRGNPSTQMISLNTPILKFNSGFGMHVVNDNLGPLNNLEAQMSYAYHLGLKKWQNKLRYKGGYIFAIY